MGIMHALTLLYIWNKDLFYIVLKMWNFPVYLYLLIWIPFFFYFFFFGNFPLCYSGSLESLCHTAAREKLLQDWAFLSGELIWHQLHYKSSFYYSYHLPLLLLWGGSRYRNQWEKLCPLKSPPKLYWWLHDRKVLV